MLFYLNVSLMFLSSSVVQQSSCLSLEHSEFLKRSCLQQQRNIRGVPERNGTEGRDRKRDVSTFGERHLKQITAVCNQEAEITLPLGRHSNQKPDQSSRQNRE